ncbi:MAG: hypothetical protein PWP56_1701 [Acetobacterium sp.]|jgi:VRR-NUC domain.|uniref:VRR-NUC domain-containing protein n=1 Tax=Acetobacterium sp. K1/6 TaxID=3055467 RepID=UPI0029DFA309|nr:VRR-NUC domain-containing protein [Acetobacterium sp. K1/6]MDK2942188.1 hypothetical protein [Acetobacterium sp.]MDZ5723467.1 VRR-NUC domain-containing protein [Acetobacterium sp. K1/6]
MREKEVEQKLVKIVKSVGGCCIKFISPGMNGVPDRLVLLPEKKMAFVEIKAPGEKLRPLQIKRMKQLSALGFICFVLDNEEEIGVILNEIQTS